jgi:AbrB family transcriptional regulator (stage V sporulation protein T)
LSNYRTNPIYNLPFAMANANLNGMNLTLDRMGRIVVPKALRDRFALKPGDDLEVILEPDGIRLRPAAAASSLAEKEGILVCSSAVPPEVWDIGAFIDQQRTQRGREMGGL